MQMMRVGGGGGGGGARCQDLCGIWRLLATKKKTLAAKVYWLDGRNKLNNVSYKLQLFLKIKK